MQVPLEITYKGFERTEMIDDLVTSKVAHLEKFHPNIISCRIGLEMPQLGSRSGSNYYVRLDLRVPPGHEIVVKRGPQEAGPASTLQGMIRQAFDTAERELRELVRLQRYQVKTHLESRIEVAHVVRLLRDQDYGFLKLESGDEIYFHRNAVLNDGFDRLTVGTGVRYLAEEGEKGMQASTVQIIDKPGARAGKGEVTSPATEPPLGWEDQPRRYGTHG